MKKLISIPMNSFSQWVLFQLLSDLLHLVRASAGEGLKLFIQKVLDGFIKAFTDFDTVLLTEKKSDKPAEFDAKRDWGIRELYAIASVYEDHFLDEDKQKAAQFLMAIFKRYGTGPDIARLIQDRQSATLTNIMQELQAEAAQPHLTALGVTALTNYIDENNTGFIASQRDVTEENMQLAGQAKTARTAAEAAWRKLRDAINGYAAVHEDDAECAALIDSLNATIERYKLTARRTRGKEADENPSADTPAGDEQTNTPPETGQLQLPPEVE